MADFAPNNTSRIWVTYTSFGIEHEMLFRAALPNVDTTFAETVVGICSEMAAVMRQDDAWVSARYADLGSDFSFPIPWTVIDGTGTNAPSAGDAESRFVSFLGRDNFVGARVRFELFTGSNAIGTDGNNRYAPGDVAALDAIVAALTTAATVPLTNARLTTISKGQPIFYSYINTGWNSYWQRKQRTT
jgi:hypothetical protein